MVAVIVIESELRLALLTGMSTILMSDIGQTKPEGLRNETRVSGRTGTG